MNKEEQTLKLNKILNKVSNSFLAFFLVFTSLYTNASMTKAQEFYSPSTILFLI